MRVFVTGATGFVGRHLTMRLLREGHEVVAWVRDDRKARSILGAEVERLSTAEGDGGLRRELERADAVINLAGAPVAERWTEARKRAMRSSRVDLTERLVRVMGEGSARPQVLVSTSAVGVYGDRGDEVLDETSTTTGGFLGELSADWEAAARGAEKLGVRVALMRVGVVLGPEGGAMAKLLPIFRAGAGGALGSGRQWMPWIHLDDLVEMYVRALHEPDWSGPINVCGPEPVTNLDFTRTLAAAVRRPAFAWVPAFSLKIMFGGAAEVMLSSNRVLPRRAEALGFCFKFPALGGALEDLLDERGVSLRRLNPEDARPDHPYVKRRRPTHVLEQHTEIEAPLDETFEFFCAAENLGAITPPALGFDIQTPTPLEIKKGAVIDYRITVGPVPMTWRTVIEQWRPGEGFVDAQHRGPYRCWYHEHELWAEGERTRMIDRVHYASPFGPLGRLANPIVVNPMLRSIFGFRARVIAERFGLRSTAPARMPERRAA